jgi:hypothetical protein
MLRRGVVEAREVEGDEEDRRKREGEGDGGENWAWSRVAVRGHCDSLHSLNRAAKRLSENDGGRELSSLALAFLHPLLVLMAEGDFKTDRGVSNEVRSCLPLLPLLADLLRPLHQTNQLRCSTTISASP